MKHSVYMTWAKRHAAARYNLANSGILRCEAADLPWSAEEVPLNGDNPEGYPPLRAAIAARYGVTEGQVALAPGTSGANFLALATLLERGDQVLVERPTYEPLLAAAETLGAEVKRFERPFERAFQPDPEELRRLVTPRTKLIVLTSPHNPSGVVLELEARDALRELAEEAGVWILVDEVYRDVLLDEAPPSAVRWGDRHVATSSLTKCYGLSGLRCGWVLAEEALAERMRRMNDLFGVIGPFPAEVLGALAFRERPRLEGRARSLLDPNLALVHDFLRKHSGTLQCVVPSRSLTVFPRLRGDCLVETLHDHLRARETSIVPGHFFESPQHFRIGFGIRTGDLAEGLRRLSATLGDISKS